MGQTWQWAKKSGGPLSEESQCIINDASGNLYITGSFKSKFYSAGSFTLVNKSDSGTYDVMVIKYNSLGTVLWARSIGGTGSDYGNSLSMDAAGNIYVTGSFKSDTLTYGTTSIYNAALTNSDLFLAKLNPSGVVQWIKSVGAPGNEVGNSISTDPAGNSYVTGYFSSDTLQIGTDSVFKTGIGPSDMLLLKYTTTGNLVWHRQYGGTGKDHGQSVKLGTNGMLYMTGTFDSDTLPLNSVNYLNHFTGTDDVALICADTSGNLSWCKTFGDSSDEKVNELIVDNAGSIYLAGRFYSPSLTIDSVTLQNSTPALTSDAFIARLNASNGACKWAKSQGGLMDDEAEGICTDGAGKLYLIGKFYSDQLAVGNTLLTNYSLFGTCDIFLSGYDTSGVAQWSTSCGREDNDFGQSVCAFSGKIYLTGHYRDTTLTFGTRIALPNYQPGNKDVYVACIAPPLLPTPLPVELISFDGKRNENGAVVLKWSTAAELNNDHFDVDRSTNGREFVRIGRVSGSGTTSFYHDYSFMDMNAPLSGTYYRLRQVDFDSREQPVAPIFVQGTDRRSVTIRSNPVLNGALEFSIHSEATGFGTIRILDATGRECRIRSFALNPGENGYAIETNSFASGIYTACFYLNGMVYQERILIP